MSHKKISPPPRYLTDEEIEYIADGLPREEIRAADDLNRDLIYEQLKEHLRSQLREIQLVPVQVEFDNLRSEIGKKYIRSRIDAGTPCGMVAADSIGEPSTQMSLNSKHISSSIKIMTSGVDRINQLIRLPDNPGNKMMTIYFTEHLTYEDVMVKKKRELMEIRIGDLIVDSDIDTIENLMPEIPWWYQINERVINPKIQKPPRYIMRLYMNYNLMYAHYISMEDVCQNLEDSELAKGSIVCVYSPIGVGIIDIYPVEDKILKDYNGSPAMRENASRFFLQIAVRNTFDKIQIKGIPNIRALEPVEESVLQVIDRDFVFPNDPNLWIIQLNINRMNTSGVNINYIHNLLDTANLEVVENINPQKYPSTRFIFVKTSQSPVSFIKDQIKKDKEERETSIKEQRKSGVQFPYAPSSELMNRSSFYYAITMGINYWAVVSRDDVDPYHTITTNPVDMVSALGIEAGRNYLLNELRKVFQGSGKYVSPRHYTLVAEFQTGSGTLLKAVFSGIQRQSTGALQKASFQQSLESIERAALFGLRDEVQSTAASIAIGKKPIIGTGFSDLFLNKEDEEKYIKRLQSSETKKVSIDGLSSALDQIDDLDYSLPTPPTQVHKEGADALNLPPLRWRLKRSPESILGSSLEPTPLPLDIERGPNISPPTETTTNSIKSDLLVKAGEIFKSVPVEPVPAPVVSIKPIPGYDTKPLTVTKKRLVIRRSNTPTEKSYQLPPVNTGGELPSSLLVDLNKAKTEKTKKQI